MPDYFSSYQSIGRVPTLTRPSFLGNGTTLESHTNPSDNDEFGLLRSSNLGTVVAYITYLPDQGKKVSDPCSS